MKKFSFLVLVFTIFVSSAAFSKKVEVIKEGGVRKILTFWKVTYDKVHFTPCGSDCDNSIGILECLKGGAITCKMSAYSTGKSTQIGKNEYTEKLIYEVCDEIMDLVDQSIFDGNEKGYVSKKICTKTMEGKEMILAFTASWQDADIKTGDVKYVIDINEI